MFVSELVLTISLAPWASSMVTAGSEISLASGIRLSFLFTVLNRFVQRHDSFSVQDAGISDQERCCTEPSNHGKEISDESFYRHSDELGDTGFSFSLHSQRPFS